MAPVIPRLRILSVGGNAISAFLSWRLQATNACDVTLVWKNGFETVSQFGISFRSNRFGNERFKPRAVVRAPEEAIETQKGAFDYVIVCIKALPDVYDLASVIESVVTPQHTCILINTSNSIGVEAVVEERFPKNVVLSLVSEAQLTQVDAGEFEHVGSTDVWVGPANWNSNIPSSIQTDMAEALAMTLESGQVQCKVSKNIRQQQFERMIGPIAFHTTSVLFETPSHSELVALTGVKDLIMETIEEVTRIAQASGCVFPLDFKEKTVQTMVEPTDNRSIMYEDYSAQRPMEVETYLGSPLQLARDAQVSVPRLQTLYAMLHHVNMVNQRRLPPPPPAAENSANGHIPSMPPRMSSMPPARGLPNGQTPRPIPGRGSRTSSMAGPPPQMRRGGPQMNGGYPPRVQNGMPLRGMQKRPSFENGNGLDEFSHVVLYDTITPDGTFQDSGIYGDASMANSASDLTLRERELAIRQKELALREREMGMRGPMRRPPPSVVGDFEDEDDGDDYFSPNQFRGPPVDPDQVDMMSITSRRNRKAPSIPQSRQAPMNGPRRGNPFGRMGPARNRTSQALMQGVLSPREDLMDNPLMGYASDRYGGVDRRELGKDGRESRTNSLTAARLNELGGSAYGSFPPNGRRNSRSPGQPFGPNGMSSPHQGYSSNGFPPNGRPSPPDMRQPVPRYPPGQGNAVAPQRVEQGASAGVSNLYPPKSSQQVRSLTGSASASAGSGDSGHSAHIDSETSAFSSQSSFGPRPPIGVR